MSLKIQISFSYGLSIFIDNEAHIQNKVLFLDEHEDFKIEKINNYIGSRNTHNEDGMKISEWKTDIKSVMDFYENLKSRTPPTPCD